MKSIKVLCLCLLLPFLHSCAKKVAPTAKIKSKQQYATQTQVRSTQLFYKVDVQGDINLVLNKSRKGSKLILKGDGKDLDLVKTHIRDGQLFINAPSYEPNHSPVTAVLSMPQINRLAYNGDGNISGTNLRASAMDLQLYVNGNVNLSGKLDVRDLSVTGKNNIKLAGVISRHLNVVMNGEVNVKIRGMANIETMKYAGEGELTMYWVKSPDLEILGYGKAKVHLAGEAHYLHAITHDQAVLDAKYLRVGKAYVKARDNSTIRLVPIKELNSLASDHGHIYYYQSPKFKADFMAQNGAVLNFEQFK